ncbi:MAG: SIMPL domain-containing protein [Thermoanaerobaculia bacterium]
MRGIVAGLSVALLTAVPVMAQDNEDAIPLVTVQGDAELHAAPDLAIVGLGVEAQEETADVAQQRVNGAADAVYEAIAGAGIPSEAIQTTGLSLSPVYSQPGPRGGGDRRLIGYRAQNVVQVRITDMERVGPVLDAGLAAGANRVDGIQFSLQDDAALRRQALTQAVAEARAKAETIAEAMGVTLASVHSVQEGGVSVQPVYARAEMMQMAADMATPVAAGQVGVSAHVTVQYRIGDGGGR